MHAYRPDIDGLRGLAILLVVLFHFFPTVLTGGFIGVDIFFVISGFLITQIISTALSNHTFSLVDFYARRIRRLIPALLVVLATGWLIGWFTLFPDEYALLGKHVLASTLFVQNFNSWSEINYFDELATTKPLLHLWSLGVEGQFYLFWPVILWLLYRWRLSPLGLISIAALASFLLNLWLTDVNPRLTFFSPQTRFWELFIGSWLAYRQVGAQPSFFQNQSLLGLGLIGVGVGMVTEFTPYPGVAALLPTLGAFLIIGDNSRAMLNRVLAGRPLVALGLISYPLYLWHWLLLTLLRISETGEVSVMARLLVMLVALVLSIFTYWWIEKPLRAAPLRRIKTSALIIGIVTIGFIGFNTFSRDGLAFRTPYQAAHAELLSHITTVRSRTPDQFLAGFSCAAIGPDCKVLEANKKKLFIWGDSHAQMMLYGAQQILPPDWTVLLVSDPGCQPAIFVEKLNATNACDRHNVFASEQIRQLKPQVVLLAQRDAWQVSTVESSFQELKNFGVQKVLYLGKTPEWTAPLPKVVIRKSLQPNERYSQAGVDRVALDLEAKAKQSFEPNTSKYYLDLVGLLCQGQACLVYLGDQLTTGLTSFDYNHLSPIASAFVANQLLLPHLQSPSE